MKRSMSAKSSSTRFSVWFSAHRFGESRSNLTETFGFVELRRLHSTGSGFCFSPLKVPTKVLLYKVAFGEGSIRAIPQGILGQYLGISELLRIRNPDPA